MITQEVVLQSSLTYALCILIMLILLFGLALNKKTKDEASTRFVQLLLSAITYFFVSLMSGICEYSIRFDLLTYVVDLLTFLAIDFIIISFLFYLRALMGKENIICKPFFLIMIFASIVSSIVTLVLFFTGNLFTIENSHYIENDLAILPYIFTFGILIIFIPFIIINRKNFTKRQFIVILIYELIPIIPIVIEYYTAIYTLSSVTLTASILIIYILIQTTKIDEGLSRESILAEISYTDSLTKINNRRAYYDAINELNKDEYVGVIFCDINGLKYTNDHFGHEAGDMLICTFANILKDYFGKKNIFRISGDEFVIILPDIQSDILDNHVKILREAIQREGSIAAIGYSFGIAQCFDKLIGEAEEFMYKDKVKTGVENR